MSHPVSLALCVLCVQLLHWLPHVRPPDCPLCSSVSSCFIGCPTCDHLSGRRQTDLCGLGKKATLPQYARSVNLKAPRFSELDVYQVCLALCLSLSLSQFSDYGCVGSTTRGQLQAQLRSQTRVASLVALPGTGTARRRAITSTLRTPATAKRERPSRRCRQA